MNWWLIIPIWLAFIVLAIFFLSRFTFSGEDHDTPYEDEDAF